MTQTVDFEQSDHSTMLDRQLLECLVQFFLELLDEQLTVTACLVGQLRNDFMTLLFIVDLFETEKVRSLFRRRCDKLPFTAIR